MKCSKAKKIFSGYLDGELKSSQKGFLEDHLCTCPDCRYELARLRSSMELIHGLPEVAAPNNFWAQVSEKIAIEDSLKKQKGSVKWFFPGERLRAGIALAAVLVFVLGISSLIYSSTTRQGPRELLSKKTTPETNETYKLSLPAQNVPEKSAFTEAGEAPASKAEESPENNEQAQLDKSLAEEDNRAAESGGGSAASITAQNSSALGSAKAQQQKWIITRISLKLKADQKEETVARLNTLASELGSELKFASAQDNSTQLELTVPVDRASEALAKIESLGEISDKKQEEQDMTEEYLILQEQEEKLRQEKEELTALNNNSGGTNEGNSSLQEEFKKIQPELDQISLSIEKLTEEMNSVHFLISMIK
ncbi:MAG: DUF4349 domain-containing protein [Eubacteriales bacterium]|jgi:hypothetical protein